MKINRAQCAKAALQRCKSMQTHLLHVDGSSISFGADGRASIAHEQTLEHLRSAARLLRDGQPVAFPTETVYGLGADATSSTAIRKIYSAKNRPADNPLISHVASVQHLERVFHTSIPAVYKPLVDKFWPGPLTILVHVTRQNPISPLCTAGQSTFAVRVPSHPVARALIQLADTPLAAPSANASSRPSPTLARHVLADLNGKIPCVLDGGSCDVGLESTVVDGVTGTVPQILRPGGITVEQIRELPGWANATVATHPGSGPVRTPGMKYKHYSPAGFVCLFVSCGDGTHAIANFLDSCDPQPTQLGIIRSRHFSPALELKYPRAVFADLGTHGPDISRNLFAALRRMDENHVGMILVDGIDTDQHGLAVMNRLYKAAQRVITGPNSPDHQL